MAMSGIASLLLGAAPMIATSKGQPTWKLPDGAVQVENDVFYLGSKKDPQSGKMVEGYAFIHRSEPIKSNARKGGPAACYSYLASGAKWKGTPEPWVMNTANTRSLNGATVFNLETNGIAKWEDAADGTVGNGAGYNIMGAGSTTNADLSVDAGTLNDANEVYFASISGSSSIIAVTSVWGIWGGPVSGRELVEWDQVYDDSDFDWSTSGAAGKMDFDNIGTHEIGHAVGMGHPGTNCVQETMYAYAGFGEILKQTLNTGDINGINQLY